MSDWIKMILEIILALLISLISLGSILPLLDSSLRSFYAPDIKSVPSQTSCSTLSFRPPYSLQSCVQTTSGKKYLVIKRTDSGFSILEIIVCLSVGLIILGYINKTYALVSFNTKAIRSTIREEISTARISSEIQRLFESTDSHPFLFKPIIHKAGEITLKDGSLNAVMNASSKIKPSINSDAITNFKLAINLLSDITDCSATEKQRSGIACLRYQNSAATSDFQSFIAISPDGTYEGEGKLIGTGKCKNFQITLADSMIFDSPLDNEKCNELLIIPLDFIQTIYQAEIGDFRLISHRTIRNVENQPLSLAQPNLGISLDLRTNIGTCLLKLSVFNQKGDLLVKEFQSLLARQSTDNFVFNNL